MLLEESSHKQETFGCTYVQQDYHRIGDRTLPQIQDLDSLAS